MVKEDAFPVNTTLGEKYHPAMEVQSQEEADAYFEKCVEHMMRIEGCSRGRSHQDREEQSRILRRIL